jgi:GIY-YIG catalytic domain
MLKKQTRRTARKDSSFIIYEAVSETGENYIGLTRKTETTVLKSLKERWRKHLSRARNEHRAWRLYEYMRAGGLEQTWEHRVLAIIRGRAEAYAWERAVVKEQQPTLNDQYR